MRNSRLMTALVGLVALTTLLAVEIAANSTEAYGSEAYTGQEKGKKKCNDLADNDGDGLIDCADPDCGGDGTGGGEGGALSLNVTFGDASTDRLQSDGEGPYVSGQEKVSANIGAHGLSLQLTRGNQPTIRTLSIDFRDACFAGPCMPPARDPLSDGSGDTVATIQSSDVNLRGMQLGEVRHDLGLRVVMKRWFLNFEPHVDCAGGSAVTVRRADADTWVIGGVGTTTKGCLLTRGVDSGVWDMPFEMTLTVPDQEQQVGRRLNPGRPLGINRCDESRLSSTRRALGRYPSAGTSRFSSSNQFSTTWIWVPGSEKIYLVY